MKISRYYLKNWGPKISVFVHLKGSSLKSHRLVEPRGDYHVMLDCLTCSICYFLLYVLNREIRHIAKVVLQTIHSSIEILFVGVQPLFSILMSFRAWTKYIYSLTAHYKISTIQTECLTDISAGLHPEFSVKIFFIWMIIHALLTVGFVKWHFGDAFDGSNHINFSIMFNCTISPDEWRLCW